MKVWGISAVQRLRSLIFICVPVASGLISLQSRASIDVDFALDSSGNSNGTGSIADEVFTLISTGLVADGVMFDAALTVTGNDDLGFNSSGLGVDGTRINNGESLTFSLSTSAISGGVVSFDGFTELDFNFYQESGDDRAIFSLDSLLGNLDDTDLGFNDLDVEALPSAPVSGFTIFGTEGTTGSPNTSFSLDLVKAQFTGTPNSNPDVPEPTSIIIWGLLGAVCLKRRRH